VEDDVVDLGPAGASAVRQEALGRLLRDMETLGAEEIVATMVELAGTKIDPNEVKPIIVLPGEGGGGF
jgi:hypothetical protein